MAGFTFLKTILIPLFLAALLYVLLAMLILPFIRRHRSRYTQYLPMGTSVSDMNFSSSWRTKVSDALYNLFAPGAWGRRRRVVDGSGEEELFDDEEGEGMVGFEPIDERGREALEQRRSMMGEERLGRELEEGFRDDSENGDDEGDDAGDGRRTSLSRGG